MLRKFVVLININHNFPRLVTSLNYSYTIVIRVETRLLRPYTFKHKEKMLRQQIASNSYNVSMRHRDGKLLTNIDETLARWMEYCEELYNHDVQKDPEIITMLTNQELQHQYDKEPPIIQVEQQ